MIAEQGIDPIFERILYPSDPIDRRVLAYRSDVINDIAPNHFFDNEDLLQVNGSQQTPAVQRLIERYENYAATIAHRFKYPGESQAETEELLQDAMAGLYMAVLSRKLMKDETFENYCGLYVDEYLTKMYGEPFTGSLDAENPSQDVREYVSKVLATPDPNSIDNARILGGMSLMQQHVLPHLHLTNDMIASNLQISNREVRELTALQQYIYPGTHNRRALALELQKLGVKFDINLPAKPLEKLLTPQQLRIGTLLGLSTLDIADLIGSASPASVRHQLYAIKNRLDARTHTEVALIFGELRGRLKIERQPRTRLEELAQKLGKTSLTSNELDGLLKDLPLSQASVIRAYYLSPEACTWQEVAESSNRSKGHATVLASRGISKMRAAAIN